LNRAVQGLYPPGSLFKIVVAAAALQAQVITPFDRLPCPRQWMFGGRPYHNWEDVDRGALTLHEALQFSCNTFFYQLGLKLGPERIVEMADKFGLGRGDASGLLASGPTRAVAGLEAETLGLVAPGRYGEPVDRSGPGHGHADPDSALMSAVANGGTSEARLVERWPPRTGGSSRGGPGDSGGRVRLGDLRLPHTPSPRSSRGHALGASQGDAARPAPPRPTSSTATPSASGGTTITRGSRLASPRSRGGRRGVRGARDRRPGGRPDLRDVLKAIFFDKVARRPPR
jgi:hypothetical protein